MRKTLSVVCAVLACGLLTDSASAQPLDHSTKLAAELYSGIMVADWATTQGILRQGGYEADPIAKPFVGHGAARTVIGATIDASLTYLAIRLARHHQKVARVAAWMAVGARSAVVVHNVRVMQQ